MLYSHKQQAQENEIRCHIGVNFIYVDSKRILLNANETLVERIQITKKIIFNLTYIN